MDTTLVTRLVLAMAPVSVLACSSPSEEPAAAATIDASFVKHFDGYVAETRGGTRAFTSTLKRADTGEVVARLARSRGDEGIAAWVRADSGEVYTTLDAHPFANAPVELVNDLVHAVYATARGLPSRGGASNGVVHTLEDVTCGGYSQCASFSVEEDCRCYPDQPVCGTVTFYYTTCTIQFADCSIATETYTDGFSGSCAVAP